MIAEDLNQGEFAKISHWLKQPKRYAHLSKFAFLTSKWFRMHFTHDSKGKTRNPGIENIYLWPLLNNLGVWSKNKLRASLKSQRITLVLTCYLNNYQARTPRNYTFFRMFIGRKDFKHNVVFKIFLRQDNKWYSFQPFRKGAILNLSRSITLHTLCLFHQITNLFFDYHILDAANERKFKNSPQIDILPF